MRTTCLLLLTISWATLTHGTGYAIPSGPASQQTSPATSTNTVNAHPQDAEHAAPVDGGKRQKDGNPSAERRDHRHVSDENHPRSPATIRKDRPKQLPNSREHFPSGNAMNLHQPGSDKSSGAAKGGLIQNATVNKALPVRPPSVVRPTAPLLNNARHRGVNPAVIGGPANSDGRNTGAINGTRVHRRP